MSVIPADCVARIAKEFADKASKAGVADVAKQLDQLAREAAFEGVPGPDLLKQAAARYAQKAEMALLIEKRNAALNASIYAERLAYVQQTWVGKFQEGLRALLTGSIEGRRGARASVAREQKVLFGQYLGHVTTELERAGLMPVFKGGDLDLPIARALWQLNTDSPRMQGIPKDAVEVAKIIHKAQEVARSEANMAGAWIGKEKGYITRQSHDPWKIEKAGQEAWVADIMPRLDWQRMQIKHGEITDRVSWLSETYTNLVSGTHLKAADAINDTGFRGPGNLAKRMSAERVLLFKSADDWFGYNTAFGTGNVREAVFHGLRMNAQNTGLMRVLGPNPEAMFQRLKDQLQRDVRDSGDVKAIESFNKAAAEDGMLDRRMSEVTGKSNLAVNHTLARWSANLRSVQSMAKLGGAVISSISDIATYGAELSYQGEGFLSGIAEGIGGLIKGRAKGEQREILSSLGVFYDSMIGDISRTGSLDESMGGGLSRLQQHYFKWNLLSWWTETLRGSAALSMSHRLALNADKWFNDLNPELQHTLQLLDINDADWQIMRKGIKTGEDGTQFMVPDDMPEAQARKLRRYIVDRSEQAVLEPDADSRAMLRLGTRAGTPAGELMRFMAQFKGFSFAFSRQILGREIYGRGASPFGDGSIKGLSQLIVASTVLGYAAMTAKDMLKGRTPRDPKDPKAIGRAMVQGGGAGIYGDFLFGEYNRMGQSPTESAAGPVIGTAADSIKLWSRLVRGEADAGDAMRLAINNTPFMNLFYTRIALDYLVLHDMQEAMAPGTLRRMEKRTEKDTGQTFLYRPSQDRARPFTQ